MTYTPDDIRTYVWEACGVYFLRCGGIVPEETLKIIKRILKSTTSSGLISTSLHRVSSDVQALCLLLEDGSDKNPLFSFAVEKSNAIFSFYRDSSALQ